MLSLELSSLFSSGCKSGHGLRAPVCKILRQQSPAFSRLCTKGNDSAKVTNLRRSSVAADYGRRLKDPTVPDNIDHVSTSCTQAADGAFRPTCGKRRQQLDLRVMRLQKHLRNT